MIDPEREPTGVKTAPKAVVGRMSLYLRQLEVYQRQGFTTVSSSQLGQPLSIKNAQVRKDLAFFGQFGHPGIGYRIPELIDALRHILGIDHDWPLRWLVWATLAEPCCDIAVSVRGAFTSLHCLIMIRTRLARSTTALSSSQSSRYGRSSR